MLPRGDLDHFGVRMLQQQTHELLSGVTGGSDHKDLVASFFKGAMDVPRASDCRWRFRGMVGDCPAVLTERESIMVNISIDYTGGLHCEAIHGPSQVNIETDAPADNQGKGEAFSPTDLVATALGTCIATTMAIVAEKHQVDLKGMTVKVAKEMASDPRRISRLTSEVHVPLPGDHPQRALLEKTALGCPVHRSLAAEMQRPTEFFWEG